MHQKLKFGIDAILAPAFGQTATAVPSSPEGSATTSSSANTSPVSIPYTPSLPVDKRAQFPAWVFCTRYSDRPSSGSRSRKPRKRELASSSDEEKRPRTAFTSEQLDRLKKQFLDNRYVNEKKRQELAHELGLNESQIKIWFQNKRAKLKKASGDRSSHLHNVHFLPPQVFQRPLHS